MVYSKKVQVKTNTMKKIILLTLILISSLGYTQDANYGENPEECKKKLTIMMAYYKQKAYSDALASWRHAFLNCPQSTKNICIIGEKVIEEKIESFDKKNGSEEELALREKYIDTLMMIHDLRLEHYAEGEKYKYLAKKGTDLFKYRAKESYEESYNLLKTVMDSAAITMSPFELQIFMYAGKYMMLTKKIDCNQMINNYLAASNVIDAKKGSKYESQYETVREKAIEYADKCLDCDLLDSLYTAGFDANKTDAIWLENGIQLLTQKKCASSNILVKMMETRFESKPDAKSAFILAKYHYSKDKVKSQNYFEKTMELEKDSTNLVDVYVLYAKFKSGQGQLSSAVLYANKALKLDKSNFDAMVVIGNSYMSAASSCIDLTFGGREVYWVAADWYAKALNAAKTEEEKADAQKRLNAAAAQFVPKGQVFLQSLNSGDRYTVGCWINQTTTVRPGE
jgi:tetratricopeptide (TPR) repeat protein